MSNTSHPMRRLQKSSSQNNRREVSPIPRGTPAAWLFRWQLATSLKDRLEMMSGRSDNRTVFRLAAHSGSILELIRRYSNDTML